MPMIRPPPYGQPPQLFCSWGEVTIIALPLVSHCVVFGAVVVHLGCAAATGASTIAAHAPVATKSGVRVRSLVRIVGLLNGPGNLWSAAAVAAAAVGAVASAAHDQRRTVELVIPRIDI